MNYPIQFLSILKSDKNEIFVVSDSEAIQLFVPKDGICKYARIKVESQNKYSKIIDSQIGTKHKIKGDISTNMWTDIEVVKVDPTRVIDAISDCTFTEILKTPMGFLSQNQ